MPEDKEQVSPTPSTPVPAPSAEANFPICASCHTPLKQIKFLDYEDIRVVFHAEAGCTVGVMAVPKDF